MMKKILLLIVSIMLLCGCNTKKEDNIQIEDGEDEFFTILSRENSYSYPSLDMLNVKINGNKSLILVPSGAVEATNMFFSPETFAGKYDILVNNDSNVEETIESMVITGENVDDSGLIVTNGTYTRYVKDMDTNFTTYYYGAAITNGYIYITISFIEEELHEEELEILKELKDVYLMDTLKLPETVIYDIVEEEEETSNVEEQANEEAYIPKELIPE